MQTPMTALATESHGNTRTKFKPQFIIGSLGAIGVPLKGVLKRILAVRSGVVCVHLRLHLTIAAVLPVLQPVAHAQSSWPTKPLRIIAPSAAGSAADTLARVVAPPLAERLGQSVVVDTRPGAATIIGTEMA